MSMSDSDSSSSYGAEYKSLKQVSRERLLHEMLRSAKTGDSKSTWKVLIMDKLTVKIMSHSCKMADITDEGVSLVEDIFKRRQPLPTMDAIYFIQPTREKNLSLLCMTLPVYLSACLYYYVFVRHVWKETLVQEVCDLYAISCECKFILTSGIGLQSCFVLCSCRAFVFFSSPIARELVMEIKKDAQVLPRIGALREMNLEYFTIDSQGFITNNERALVELFGDEENNRKAVACLNVMATRIATVFASLREFPFVRFRAAKSLDATTMTTFHDLIPTKLAAGVWDCLMKYKKTVPNFPQTESCELLIIDRTIDQIAPVIHEWTYDAMCRDLLNMEGNKYVHEVPSKTGGPPERKEVLLEDHDPIWLELRHAHIADASERLHEKMTNFISKNKAAQIQHGSRLVLILWEFFINDMERSLHCLCLVFDCETNWDQDWELGGSGEMSTRDLQKMVQALPQYSEQIDKLSLHVEVSSIDFL
ncbi:SNARE-interacting protein KEULE [Glycine max]|nr:SNARE-interacting protein KEULE [Glycine max]